MIASPLSMSHARFWLKPLLLSLLVLLFIEAASWLASPLLAKKGLLLLPQKFDTSGYEAYLGYRDPVLGWPGPEFRVDRDSRGSRITPSFPDPETSPTCVTLFGDSYTWAAEVSHSEAWGNLLSGLLGCRVANYGMGGYGTDQAYLRFRHRVRDESRIVVLAHFSRGILRNLSQYRGFFTRRLGDFSFKPRFVPEPTGRPRLIPLPELTEREFADLAWRADELLPHDYFRPGGPGGITLRRFPCTVSVLRLLSHYSLRARFRGLASHVPFYERSHASEGLATSVQILRAFDRDARERGQTPVVLVIPALSDLDHLREKGELVYGTLVADLAAAGIAVPPLAEEMLAYLGAREPGELFEPNVHFNAEGNEVLAKTLYRWMRDEGLLDLLSGSNPGTQSSS